MEINIKGDAKEIAALVLAVQGRRVEMEEIADGVGEIFAKTLHQTIQDELARSRARRESR